MKRSSLVITAAPALIFVYIVN